MIKAIRYAVLICCDGETEATFLFATIISLKNRISASGIAELFFVLFVPFVLRKNDRDEVCKEAFLVFGSRESREKYCKK